MKKMSEIIEAFQSELQSEVTQIILIVILIATAILSLIFILVGFLLEIQEGNGFWEAFKVTAKGVAEAVGDLLRGVIGGAAMILLFLGLLYLLVQFIKWAWYAS